MPGTVRTSGLKRGMRPQWPARLLGRPAPDCLWFPPSIPPRLCWIGLLRSLCRSLAKDGALVLPLLVLAHVLGVKVPQPAAQPQQAEHEAPPQAQAQLEAPPQAQEQHEAPPHAQAQQVHQAQAQQAQQAQGQQQAQQQAHGQEQQQVQLAQVRQAQQQAGGPGMQIAPEIAGAAAAAAGLATPQRAAAGARQASAAGASSSASAAAEPEVPTPGPLRRVKRRLHSPDRVSQQSRQRQGGPGSSCAAAGYDVIDLTHDD